MKAILLNITAWSILPFMDGIAKYLSLELHFIQVVWARYFFMILISLPIGYFFFKKSFKKKINLKIQILRSLFLFLSTIFFFYAISVISLAEALTLMFCSPIIVTILSVLILKESVDLYRWIAVIAGLVGVLIVIRPWFNQINLASVSALGAGICYAMYIISTRKLSFHDSPIVTLIFTGLFGAIVISFIVPFYWITPNFNQLMLMICLASFGTLGHFFLILSLNYAEASKLAPFAYFEIVTNVLIGYYFFGDFPSLWLWLGLFIIIISGIYISINEKNKSLTKHEFNR